MLKKKSSVSAWTNRNTWEKDAKNSQIAEH